MNETSAGLRPSNALATHFGRGQSVDGDRSTGPDQLVGELRHAAYVSTVGASDGSAGGTLFGILAGQYLLAYPGIEKRRNTGCIAMPNEPGPDQPRLDLPDAGQAGPQLAMVLENDRKSMHLRIGKDGKLLAGLVLSADQVEGLMAGLAQVRERMLPELPPKPAPAGPTPVERAAPQPAEQVAPEPAPTEFSTDIAHPIKGTHYDFGIDENTRQLVFSVRDQGLGWLSFRFGVRLLERMLKVARTAQKPVDSASSPKP
jgi:hypothetical protein